MSFTDDEKVLLAKTEIKEAIEKLNNILQQNQRIFLIGAGCSFCAELPLLFELTDLVLNECKLTETGEVLAKIKSLSKNKGTIEDYISELIDYLAIGIRRTQISDSKDEIKILIDNKEYNCDSIKKSIEEIKKIIKNIIDKKVSIDVHREFVSHVHNTIRPGKQNIQENVDYIILNYDTIFEDALAFENISFVDGFSGNSSAYWLPDSFLNLKFKARVVKLHGSIDWMLFEDENYPRRAGSRVKYKDESSHSIMIYPASTKYIETQLDPFAKLFDVARLCLKSEKNSQKVLITIGYGFGDAHVNREIKNALINSNGHLTLIIFSNDENNKIIKDFRISKIFGENVLVYSQNGFFHGNKETRLNSGETLEWWKFEKLTKLLKNEI